MTPDDLARIHAQCFTTPRPWTAAELAGLLQSPNVFLLTHGQGFLLGRVILDEAELLTLAVAPDARRTGTGTALVAAFLNTAAQRGAATAFLEVADSNLAARALYARAGFAETGRRPRYYHHPDGQAEDAILMARGLGAPDF